MGTGIAALAASAGFPVVLLDVPDSPERDGRARSAIDKALKSRAPAFLDPSCAARIAVGNTEDHLDRLAECDWIVEAIIERPAPKQDKVKTYTLQHWIYSGLVSVIQSPISGVSLILLQLFF
jgi:3-hydroxyacyl-CoA dehydrogenase